MAVEPANLIDIQNNYSNLQTLTQANLNLALIPNRGKLQTKGVVLRAVGVKAKIGYKCSSSTSVN